MTASTQAHHSPYHENKMEGSSKCRKDIELLGEGQVNAVISQLH